MFLFDAPLFWYKLIFMSELFFAEFLATHTLKKRSLFPLRLILAIVALYAVAFLFPLLFNAFYLSFMFFFLFGMTLLAMTAIYNEPFINILFCGTIAYTTQHIAYTLFNVVCTVSGFGSYGEMYAQTGSYALSGFNVVTYVLAYGLTYWATYTFIEYRIRRQEDLSINNVSLLALSVAVVLSDIVLNAILTYGIGDLAQNTVVVLVVGILSIMCCALVMGIQFYMLKNKVLENERDAVRDLWARDKEMYELSKRNVELINIKCHDLKKQLRALRKSDGEVNKDALAEIENAVNIYDSTVKTGCGVLDIILAEKSLVCNANGVELLCIADGEKLNFISEADLYSLFENALSNAIESVIKEKDKEKRIIRLRVNAIGNLLSVHIDNYCPEVPQFVGGLPCTTKENNGYHGYGVRSMQLLAEKYGGELNVFVEDNVFNLNIVLPMPCDCGECATRA